MTVAELDKLYKDTEDYVQSLEDSFLNKHLTNPLAAPDDYDLDVKSYCILCHAALEDFTELIALKVMHYTIETYITSHKISESLMCLLHFKASGLNYFDKLKDNDVVNVFDYVRVILTDIKSNFSKEIVMKNHGVSIKYMRQLLMPVAIDIPNDANLINSLTLLAGERGFYAHKFLEKGSIKKSISPEDAKKYVEDCLLLIWDFRNKAQAKIT